MNLKANQLSNKIFIVIYVAVCLLAVSFLPSFDLDESVYRRMAEEMKATGQWLVPHWDGQPYHHKPPTYVWLIAMTSLVFDGIQGEVSLFSSRLPSIVVSALTFLLLRQSAPLHRKAQTSHILIACLLPIAGSMAILLDPLLVFFMALSFVSLRKFLDKPFWYSHAVTIGICGALATKGLIGLILPCGAFGLTLLSQPKLRKEIPKGLWIFVPGMALGCLFYAAIGAFGSWEFVSDFFIVHHFGRSATAMEGHGGPWYYHIAVLVLGGGVFTSLLIQRVTQKVTIDALIASVTFRFEVLWAVVILCFFSLVSTKLPNYIWPAWIGLTSAALAYPSSKTSALSFTRKILSVVPLCLIALIFVALPFALPWATALNPKVAFVSQSVALFPALIGFGLMTTGFLFALTAWYSFHGRFYAASCFQIATLVPILTVITPWADKHFVAPAYALAKQANQRNLLTMGLYSPNASRGYASSTDANSRTKSNQRLEQAGKNNWDTAKTHNAVLTYIWNALPCEEQGFSTKITQGIFALCLK